MNRLIIAPTAPAVKPTSFDNLFINQQFIARVDELRALAAAPLDPAPVRIAVADGTPCVRCHADTLDSNAALCPDCSDEGSGF